MTVYTITTTTHCTSLSKIAIPPYQLQNNPNLFKPNPITSLAKTSRLLRAFEKLSHSHNIPLPHHE